MTIESDDRTNLDDPSAHYGLDHAPALKAAARRREFAQRTGTPIDEKGRLSVALPDVSTDINPALEGKSPEQIAQILADHESHRNGCADPACSRCSQITERDLRGDHQTTGGGSGGGRRRRKASAAGGSTGIAMAHVYEDEIKDLRPRNVAGRVSNEAYSALYADGNPSIGEMLEVVGRALHRGLAWESIVRAIAEL